MNNTPQTMEERFEEAWNSGELYWNADMTNAPSYERIKNWFKSELSRLLSEILEKKKMYTYGMVLNKYISVEDLLCLAKEWGIELEK